MALIRLLQRGAEGAIFFREPTGGDVPAYAILSHTWENEEISFQDVEVGTAKSKAGWKKIEFCAEQAAIDGLEYFWIDTCCIDKKNAVEVSAAINSMFRWYQNAKRCYVYLSDVSVQGAEQDEQLNRTWEAAFRKSRWFTRGWTLQELIAPAHVDFFSSESERLGNKMSLEDLIHDITGIARNALHNDLLSSFSIDEQRSWAECRNTTLEEDKAYCLLGIFDVSMSPIYGEGVDRAIKRLQHKIHISYKGTDFERFSVGIDLLTMPQPAQFVAREEELTEMHRMLHGHNNRSVVVLNGLGGVGKTQLALAYARRHKEKYTAIFWLNANDDDSLRLSFRDIAQQILEDQRDNPSTNRLANLDLDGDRDQVAAAVKAWLNLQNNTRWLMIYDNHDNPKLPHHVNSSAVDIRRFLPRADHGSIIITTGSAQVSQGDRIHVPKLQRIQDSLQILSNTSKRENIETDPSARSLAEELDGLPLALSTAGAYLEHITISFSDYLRLYTTSWSKLLSTTPPLSSYEDRSLYTTWQITFDRIQQQNAASAKLLRLWAYFDKQDVWFGLLRHANSTDDVWIQKLIEDELSFNEAVTLLCSFGLVEPDFSPQFGSGGYSVHSCVHSWMSFVLNKKWDEALARLALTCVVSELASTNKNPWFLERRLLQHATRQGRYLVEDQVGTDGLDGFIQCLGRLYTNQGKWAEAEAIFTHALQRKEEAVGPKHISTLEVVNDLGCLYERQERLAEAEMMYIRVLQSWERVRGPKHLSTLATVSSLGYVYLAQGRLVQAEATAMRALQGFMEILGPKHTLTLKTQYCLGGIYYSQGRLAQAMATYIQVLQGDEEVLGPKHPSTVCTVFALGRLYCDQDRLTEAETMLTRALRDIEEALAPNHPTILRIACSLGNVYRRQCKVVEAESMIRQNLKRLEDAPGPKHQWISQALAILGQLYEDQGKLTEAETMYNRALQGYEGALGPEFMSSSPAALRVMFILGNLFLQTGRKDMANEMYIRVQSGYRVICGPSPKWVRQLEDWLQASQPASVESKAGQDGSNVTESGARRSRSLKRKLSAGFEGG
ncbi:MAG: hypothetical protein M1822_002804 [Bathelium mastoideum]|nr:MAG: hypothetical protein M1822_002804 [Bathelium mastoideum]